MAANAAGQTEQEQFIVVTKSSRDARVYTGRGFSKYAKKAQVHTCRRADTYAVMDAMALASNAYPGSPDGLDSVMLEGRSPEQAVQDYMAGLRRDYGIDNRLTKAQLAFLRKQLGEGFHAGFRKATDHPSSHQIWTLIRDLPDAEYRKVIDFVVWGLEVSQGSTAR